MVDVGTWSEFRAPGLATDAAAVEAIHNERIVHADLKPANFLFVDGALKLIDFGIAKPISDDTTNIYRESQVGTLNYMSPEALEADDDDAVKLGRL